MMPNICADEVQPRAYCIVIDSIATFVNRLIRWRRNRPGFAVKTCLLIAMFTLPTLGCAETNKQASDVTESSELLWHLAQNSQVNFVSIKKSSVAEVHRFTALDGSIDSSGLAILNIHLASVETQIDIRNQRMREHLFEVARFPIAKITAQVDVTQLEAMVAGQESIEQVTWSLDLHGVTNEFQSSLRIIKLSSEAARVASVEPIIVNSSQFELTDGVKKLKSLAALPSIALAIPVTLDLHWQRSVTGTNE